MSSENKEEHVSCLVSLDHKSSWKPTYGMRGNGAVDSVNMVYPRGRKSNWEYFLFTIMASDVYLNMTVY